MKKLGVLIVLFLIFTSFLVLAQELPDTGTVADDITGSGSDDSSLNASSVGAGVKESFSGAGEKVEGALEKDVPIPENLQLVFRILFGFKAGEDISFSVFIVVLAIWVGLLLIISSVLEITPFFGRGWKKWLGGIVVTLLIAQTGAIKSISVFFFNFGNVFGILEKWSILKIIFAVVIIVVLILGLRIILRIVESRMGLDAARTRGDKIAALGAEAEAAAEPL